MKTLPIDDHNQGIFFHKLGHFFPIFEKGQGRPPLPPPSSYAPVEIQIFTDDDNSRGFIFASTKNAFAISFNIGESMLKLNPR